ncbi:unnamed protein product [Brassica rapa subsp. trilocularis]
MATRLIFDVVFHRVLKNIKPKLKSILQITSSWCIITSETSLMIYWDGRRVLGVLATSRAIGDNYLKPYVSSEPEVTVTERIEEDEFMILASDGLWDVVTNDAACATVQMYLNKKGGRGGGRRREATECEERKEEKVVGSRKNVKRGKITYKA